MTAYSLIYKHAVYCHAWWKRRITLANQRTPPYEKYEDPEPHKEFQRWKDNMDARFPPDPPTPLPPKSPDPPPPTSYSELLRKRWDELVGKTPPPLTQIIEHQVRVEHTILYNRKYCTWLWDDQSHVPKLSKHLIPMWRRHQRVYYKRPHNTSPCGRYPTIFNRRNRQRNQMHEARNLLPSMQG